VNWWTNRPRRAARPDAPQEDTTVLVPVQRLEADCLISTRGKRVAMLELESLDTGPEGLPLEAWMDRYSLTLERLPPGTQLQVCVQLAVWDPLPDLAAFLQAARQGHAVSQDAARSARRREQAAALALAAERMTACTACWFDQVRPITWHTLFVLSANPPGLQAGRAHSRSRAGEDPAGDPAAREALDRAVTVLTAASHAAGLPLRRLTVPEMAQPDRRAIAPPSWRSPWPAEKPGEACRRIRRCGPRT